MDLGLNGRVAIVTAASRGLGRATALALAAEGCNLVLNARRADALRASAADCRRLGARVVEVAGDVTHADVPAALVAAATDTFERLDIAIGNAGGPPAGHALDVTDAQIRDAVDANLLSSVRLARASLPLMTENRFGRIVCISSVAVKHPMRALALSGTARAGLYAWCKTAAADLASEPTTQRVTVNLACPGPHATGRIDELSRAGGRMGNPADFGRVVAFLCSEAASFITGQAILVEGGGNLGL